MHYGLVSLLERPWRDHQVLKARDQVMTLRWNCGKVFYQKHMSALVPSVYTVSAAGGVAASSGGKLGSFQDTETGGVRLYFIGTNNHVYELYWATEGTSSETDVTAASGSTTTAASGTSLSGVMEPR